MEFAPDILSLVSEILISETKNFNILQIKNNSLVNYQFDVIDGRVKAYYPMEIPLPALDRILPSALVGDDHTKRWWNSVFFIENEVCTYDSFYDDLAISDLLDYKECNIGNFIGGLTDLFKDKLNTSAYTSRVYIVGDKVCLPLRYVLQSLLPHSKFIPAPACKWSDNLDKDKIHRPSAELEAFRIYVDVPCSANNLVDEEMRVVLPSEFMDLNTLVVKDCSWDEIIVDPKPEYFVGKIGFKILYLSVDYDICGDIYLTSRDMSNNVITKKL